MKRRWRAWVLALLALAAGGGAVAWWASGRSAPVQAALTAAVTRGTMVVSVTESGEVKADRNKVIANELDTPVTIRELSADGAVVQKGELIVRFECKELMDTITQEEITVTQAQNEFTQAHENLELKRKEMANNVLKAIQAVEDANSALGKYQEGEWSMKLSEAQSILSLAQRKLKLAQDRLAFKIKANRMPELQNPYSQTEIDADGLDVQGLGQDANKAEASLAMLIKYDDPLQRRKLAAAVEDARLNLERARVEEKTQVLVAQDLEKTKKVTLDMQQSKLDKSRDDANKLAVTSNDTGLVTYDSGRTWGNPVVVQVGEKINPRQQIIVIPDLTTLVVQTRVSEAAYSQIKPGLKAYVRLDAMPDKTFTGSVVKVAPMPSQQDPWLNPNVKFIKVSIKLESPPENLKPNMNAQVELELARLDDVLQAPAAAVFIERDEAYCWAVRDGRPQRAGVKVGRMGKDKVEIVSGLQEGDRVLLVAPAGAEGDKGRAGKGEGQPSLPGAAAGPEARK